MKTGLLLLLMCVSAFCGTVGVDGLPGVYNWYFFDSDYNIYSGGVFVSGVTPWPDAPCCGGHEILLASSDSDAQAWYMNSGTFTCPVLDIFDYTSDSSNTKVMVYVVTPQIGLGYGFASITASQYASGGTISTAFASGYLQCGSCSASATVHGKKR